jgi:hypothetical protein
MEDLITHTFQRRLAGWRRQEGKVPEASVGKVLISVFGDSLAAAEKTLDSKPGWSGDAESWGSREGQGGLFWGSPGTVCTESQGGPALGMVVRCILSATRKPKMEIPGESCFPG